MKSRIILSFTPVSLFLGASALAAPIGGYDAWTVNAGVITATCPAGHTCTNLDATGNGILQQKMVDNADTTVSYFRTIVTEEGANASDLASVQALGFRIEGQIGIDGGGNNYTNRSVIKSGTQLGNDAMETSAEISQGALLSGSLAHFVADQEQGLGATTRRMDWHFHEGGLGYLELNHYSTGGVAGGATGNEGAITVRRVNGVSGGGTLTLGASPTEGVQTLSYAAGNSVTAVWMTQAVSGVGSFTNRTLGLQRYSVVTTGSGAKGNVGGTSVDASNADGAGNFIMQMNGVASEISGTQFGWNTALFGVRPQEYFMPSISSGVVAPPAPGTFANNFMIP